MLWCMIQNNLYLPRKLQRNCSLQESGQLYKCCLSSVEDGEGVHRGPIWRKQCSAPGSSNHKGLEEDKAGRACQRKKCVCSSQQMRELQEVRPAKKRTVTKALQTILRITSSHCTKWGCLSRGVINFDFHCNTIPFTVILGCLV